MNRVERITTRQAAARLRVPHSTVCDFIRKYGIKTTKGTHNERVVNYPKLRRAWNNDKKMDGILGRS